MLRDDTKFMLKKDWEPKVPSEETIRKQILRANGRISGSVRLATTHIIVDKKKKH